VATFEATLLRDIKSLVPTISELDLGLGFYEGEAFFVVRL